MEGNMNTLVQTRVDTQIKKQAEAFFKAKGMTMAQALRMFLYDVAENKKVSFSYKKYPNEQTCQAMQDIKEGKNTKRFSSVKTFMDDLLSE